MTLAVELQANTQPTITVHVDTVGDSAIDAALNRLAEDDEMADFIVESGYTVVHVDEVGP